MVLDPPFLFQLLGIDSGLICPFQGLRAFPRPFSGRPFVTVGGRLCLDSIIVLAFSSPEIVTRSGFSSAASSSHS